MARHSNHLVWRDRVFGRIDKVNRENERAELKREQLAREKAQSRMVDDPPVTDFEMAEVMVQLGSSFTRLLGQAWLQADEINRAKIVATWPEYCDEYRDLARLKRERARLG